MKLIYKIIIPIFAVFLGMVIVVQLFLHAEIKNAVFQESFLSLRDNILKRASQFLSAGDFQNFQTSEAQKAFNEFFEEVIGPSTARITLWSPDGVVIFSDFHSLIGQKSEYNPDLKKAISEKSSFFMVRPEDIMRPKHSDMTGFLDIYVPIELSGEFVGVVEIHAISAAVLQPLERALNNILYILILSGVAELIAIFAIVRLMIIKPLKKLEAEILKIKRGGVNE